MAFVLANRVQETTTTTGTGAVTLNGTSTGFQSFSAVGNGNVTFYTITDDTDWEVGVGTYFSSGPTLTREEVLESSNNNQLVNWGSGEKQVFVTYPASQAVFTFPNNVALAGAVSSTGAVTGVTVEISFSVEYLVVAGGGGGGGVVGGGGGAGGFRTGNTVLGKQTPYTVTVGAGGLGGIGYSNSPNEKGSPGTNSVFSTVTSAGGGGGGGNYIISGASGTAGGSGGGGGAQHSGSSLGGAGNTPSVSPSQGNNGGSGLGINGSGGGGGASAVGVNAPASGGGNGGNGTASSISGSSVTYAGGGGGGARPGAPAGTGGTGGGGNGSVGTVVASNGTANTGGGAGGAGYSTATTNRVGGNGGSGVVILKYGDTLTLSNPGGGLTFSTSTAVSGYKITTFTAGTGNVEFT